MHAVFAEHGDAFPADAVLSARAVKQVLCAELAKVHIRCVQRMEAVLEAMGLGVMLNPCVVCRHV